MITLGILADRPDAATGMAVVNHNLTLHLRKIDPEIRIIYFGRFGALEGVAPDSRAYHGYEVVDCEGGVWKTEIVEELIERYKVNIVYSEDDWWSANGLVEATQNLNVPFYFMTPIDSLPIQREAHDVFRKCEKVFVPNQSYKYIENGIHLPHAVDWLSFKPMQSKPFKKFTFLWIGRDEERKSLDRVIQAFYKTQKEVPCNLVVRSNWGDKHRSVNTDQYIKFKNIKIIQDRMTNCEHEYLAKIYGACHAFICSSKAGACEMSVLEAQACGTPPLVTDWTFMNENVIEGKTGFKIPIDSYSIQGKINDKEGSGRIWGNISIDKLSEKMIWMVKNPKKSWIMGMNGMDFMRKNYNWNDVAEKFYHEVILDYKYNFT